MAFNHQTPESLLGRSDSKNPATTCRGLTIAGKPCRRGLAAVSGSKGRGLQTGVVAVVESNNGNTLDAAFFCWQHKDQAQQTVPSSTTATTVPPRYVTITERTSIDSLVERLGVAHLTEKRETHVSRNPRPQTRSPQMKYERPASPARYHQTNRRPARPGFFAALCCFGGSSHDDDYYEIVRHRQRSTTTPRQHASPQSRQSRQTMPVMSSQETTQQNAPRRPQPAARPAEALQRTSAPRRPLANLPPAVANRQPQSSPANRGRLSYIPSDVSPETAAKLQNELSKPISPHDVEGYIYIFWLTDSDKVPDQKMASSLLNTDATDLARMNGLVRSHSVRSPHGRKTILLKIGRANNVHRRMNEWTQQCGYALSLLRWYPYVSNSPRSSPVRKPAHPSRPSLGSRESSDQVRKVPHVHRVERLIHLELAGKRVKKDCAACGKEHREWFEIEASMEGVKAVDEAVRRWVRWAEESV